MHNNNAEIRNLNAWLKKLQIISPESLIQGWYAISEDGVGAQEIVNTID